MQGRIHEISLETLSLKNETTCIRDEIKSMEEKIKFFNKEANSLKKEKEKLICQIVVLSNHKKAIHQKLLNKEYAQDSILNSVNNLIKYK